MPAFRGPDRRTICQASWAHAARAAPAQHLRCDEQAQGPLPLVLHPYAVPVCVKTGHLNVGQGIRVGGAGEARGGDESLRGLLRVHPHVCVQGRHQQCARQAPASCKAGTSDVQGSVCAESARLCDTRTPPMTDMQPRPWQRPEPGCQAAASRAHSLARHCDGKWHTGG